jgi:hypothetical protein
MTWRSVVLGLPWVCRNFTYFSPEASAIAIATKAFQTFDVTQCTEKPNLDGFEKVTIS